jgi:hypothetical protein
MPLVCPAPSTAMNFFALRKAHFTRFPRRGRTRRTCDMENEAVSGEADQKTWSPEKQLQAELESLRCFDLEKNAVARPATVTTANQTSDICPAVEPH